MEPTPKLPKGTTLLLSLVLLSAIIKFPWIEKFYLNNQYIPIVYLDLQGILAPLESIRAGLNPYLDTSFDPGNRPHVYGPLWLYLVYTNVSLEDTFWLGTISAFSLIILSCILTKPQTMKETLILLIIMFSPPIVLAFTRMNSDVYIYILVVFSSWLLSKNFRILACLTSIINFGLKYYPALIIYYPLTFIKGKKSQKLLALGLSMIIIGLFVFWRTTYEGINQEMPSPIGSWTFAGPNVFRELGITPELSRTLSIITLLLMSIMILGKTIKNDTTLTNFKPNLNYHLFIQCVVLLIGATVIKEAYSYRLIFILGMLPWTFECLKKHHCNSKVINTWLFTTIISLWIEWIGIKTFIITFESFPLIIENESKINILWSLNFLKDIFYWVFIYITLKLTLGIGQYRYIMERWGINPQKNLKHA